MPSQTLIQDSEDNDTSKTAQSIANGPSFRMPLTDESFKNTSSENACASSADTFSGDSPAKDTSCNSFSTDEKFSVSVFDFDGTCLDGNSPVLLVRYMFFKGLLPFTVLFRILMWGLAYKLHLPQNETWVRGLVFKAFEGKPKHEVDKFLSDFYDKVVASRFRQKADDLIRAHLDAGEAVFLVSASFEPIILRVLDFHPFTDQASTRMLVAPDGTYTRKVDGAPVEGAEKLHALARLANAHFGEGNWKLNCVYGDHHSDRPMLDAAAHAYAVNPDNLLARTAREKGWTILSW